MSYECPLATTVMLDAILVNPSCIEGYRINCRHQFTAYTLFFGPPIIFCTPNIADNRNILILLTQGEEINLDLDSDPDLKLTYEELRLKVVNDPVGQCLKCSSRGVVCIARQHASRGARQ